MEGIFLWGKMWWQRFRRPPPRRGFQQGGVFERSSRLRQARVVVLFLLVVLGIWGIWKRDFGPGDVAFYRDMGRGVLVEGMVSEQPEVRNGGQYVVLEAREIAVEDFEQEVRGRILVKMRPYPEFEYGFVVTVEGDLLSPPEFEDFDYGAYLANDSIYAVMYGPKVVEVEKEVGWDFWRVMYVIKGAVRQRLEELFAAPADSIAMGLLLGERASIPQEILDDFKTLGLTHILAISGYNITLIITIFALLLKRFGRNARTVLTLGGIALFAILTGLSASVVRASIMGALTVLALSCGRKTDGVHALLLSALVMAFMSPRILLGDISFQLSFMATLGLLVLLPRWEDWFARFPAFVQEGLSVTLAATVFTTPITLYHFGLFSLISPLANLLFLPFIPLIMTGSFFALAASVLFSPFAFVLVGITFALLKIMLWGTGFLAPIPFALLEIPGFSLGFLVAYYALIWMWLTFGGKSKQGQD